MGEIGRRDFIGGLLIATAALAGCDARPSEHETSARRRPPRVRLGIIGLGGHGTKHLQRWLTLAEPAGVAITYLCDPDQARLDAAMARAHGAGAEPKAARDLRRVLESDQVDAVVIATPHHWHALAAIWAMQAGKHVYLEKPATHLVGEGPSLLAAARRYKVVCQAGTQYRSQAAYAAARAAVRERAVGAIGVAHCVAYRRRDTIGPAGDHAPPASLDLELWSGPAPLAPRVARRRFHYDWHWFWDHGNGGIGNNGLHRVDLARDALGLDGAGRGVLSVGGRYGYVDAGQTPNSHLTIHAYDGVALIQDVRGLPSPPYRTIGSGVVFAGEGGFVTITSGKAALLDPAGALVRPLTGEGGVDHHLAFVDAIDGGDPARLTDLGGSVASADLCHVGNVSHRLGAPATLDQVRDAIDGAPLDGARVAAHDALDRMLAHLGKHRVDLAGQPLTLGPWLDLAPHASGRPWFPGVPAAEALVGRVARAPFVVPPPEQV
jgi:predicted dehydrogenase